jgi:TIR domain
MTKRDEKILTYDFAISYAGEDTEIADRIYNSLKEKYQNFNIFYALKDRNKLVGNDGEEFFENLFNTAKQVIVILSENYKKKEWTRYEWDIIKERNKENRCIPIKVDNVKILGLPSNFIYLKFDGNHEDIANLCIEKLVTFEKSIGFERKSDLQKMTDVLGNSRGTVDKAVQLVIDNRERTPLKDINYPSGKFKKLYNVIKIEELPYSKLLRLSISINLPDHLDKEEVSFNIKYCTVDFFNKRKPDAIKIFVYSSKASNFIEYQKFNVARADFAPFGDWGQAEEGFAYNLSSDKFDWRIEFEESYFNKKKHFQTGEELARELVMETLKKKR